MNLLKVWRTPHLISIQLIRAPKLVPVLVLVDAFIQRLMSLMTHLLVPAIVGGVAQQEHSVLVTSHIIIILKE